MEVLCDRGEALCDIGARHPVPPHHLCPPSTSSSSFVCISSLSSALFSPLRFDFPLFVHFVLPLPAPFASTSLPSNHTASSVAVMLKPSRARGIVREQRGAARGLTRACALATQWAMQAETHGVMRQAGGPAAAAAGLAGRTAMIGQRGAGESGDKTSRVTPSGAMALPPQQRRRPRVIGLIASPRLAS